MNSSDQEANTSMLFQSSRNITNLKCSDIDENVFNSGVSYANFSSAIVHYVYVQINILRAKLCSDISEIVRDIERGKPTLLIETQQLL